MRVEYATIFGGSSGISRASVVQHSAMASEAGEGGATMRKRARTQNVSPRGDETQEQLRATLDAAMQELRSLREERQALTQGNGGPAEPARPTGQFHFDSLALKPDQYDGTTPFSEYIGQFEMIARANNWTDQLKSIQLAANLRGKARSVLENWEESLGYAELKTRIDLRFGIRATYQSSYIQFSNRKQEPGEDFASLGEALERLAHFAYPECSPEIRDKISCAQFVAAISDGYIKRALQMENITSLRTAVERALTLSVIQANSFPRRTFPKSFERHFPEEPRKQPVRGYAGRKDGNQFKTFEPQSSVGPSGDNRGRKPQNKECWQCGKTGHFRAECPAVAFDRQAN